MQLLTVSLGLMDVHVPVEGFKGFKPLKPFAYPYPLVRVRVQKIYPRVTLDTHYTHLAIKSKSIPLGVRKETQERKRASKECKVEHC